LTPGTWLHAASSASGGAANWIVAWVAIATAACTALAFLGRRLWHLRQRALHLLAAARQVLGDFTGTEGRPGIPARPGVMEQLSALSDAVARLNAQVIPNGGSSLRDAVDQVADDLREHREVTSPAIAGLAADMAEVRADVAGVKDDVARMAGRMDTYEDQRAKRDLARWPGSPPAKGKDGPA
jgi:outer membrane murein-binding lipoprotein Lpp